MILSRFCDGFPDYHFSPWPDYLCIASLFFIFHFFFRSSQAPSAISLSGCTPTVIGGWTISGKMPSSTATRDNFSVCPVHIFSVSFWKRLTKLGTFCQYIFIYSWYFFRFSHIFYLFFVYIAVLFFFITKNVSFYKKRIPAILILPIVGLEVLW